MMIARKSGMTGARRAALLATVAGAALVGTTARAQVAAPPSPPVALAAADTDAGAEIVVTAQRRAERLQDVPLSVSVLSGEQLKNANVTSIDRLEQLVPGVRIGRSGPDARPAIRGTYTENISATGDPRIGVYIDDIYQSRTSQIPPVVDLQRVEVQKGPQGTLYGRNSFGGNIAFFSATPKDTFAAGVDALYGRYNRRRIEGFVNVPISGDLAARVAGLYEKADGYVKNIGTGNDVGDTDEWFVRGTLRFAPKSLDDRLEVLLRASYDHQGGAGNFSFGYKFLGTLVDPSAVRAPGQSLTRNGVTYTLPNGFNGNGFTGLPYAIDTRYRDGIPDVGGADVGIPTLADPYKINTDGVISRRLRQQQYSGTINFDAGPVKLRSISSYTDFYLNRSGDDITPAPLNLSYIKNKTRTYTQELQILSNDKSSRFQWIIGGYYLNDNVTEQSVTNVNRAYKTTTAAPGQQFYTFGFTYAPTAANAIDQTFAYDSFSALQQKTRSLAGYGQASYTLFDKLTLTAGARYTSDRKTVLSSRFNATATGGVGSSYYVNLIDDPVNYQCGGLIAANAASNATNIANAYNFVCGKLTANYVTYRGAVDYKFDRDHLIYGSYSTGRHAGGFNSGAVTVAGVPTLLSFAPEKVEAYEVGSKNQFLDGRLTFNVAAFVNNFRDLQAQTSIPNPNNPLTGVIALVQNIGRDRAYGADLEAVVKPDKHLTVNVAFNYLHARELDYAVNVFEFGGAATFCNITPDCTAASGERNTVQGTPFPSARTDPNRFIPIVGPDGKQIVIGGVPQFKYVIAGRGLDGTKYTSKKSLSPDYTVQVGAAYTIDLGAAGTLTPEVQTYFNAGYLLTDLTPNFGNQKAYTKTDLRLTYLTENGKIRVQAFVDNVEDQAVVNRVAYSNHRSLLGNYAPPRTWGISAGYRF